MHIEERPSEREQGEGGRIFPQIRHFSTNEDFPEGAELGALLHHGAGEWSWAPAGPRDPAPSLEALETRGSLTVNFGYSGGSHRGLALPKPLQVPEDSERAQAAKFKGRPGGRAELRLVKYHEPQALLRHPLLRSTFALVRGSGSSCADAQLLSKYWSGICAALGALSSGSARTLGKSPCSTNQGCSKRPEMLPSPNASLDAGPEAKTPALHLQGCPAWPPQVRRSVTL